MTLDSNGPEHGACANEDPVLYQSSIVDYGTTIAIGRFSCLVERIGIYCLEASADAGFSATDKGYQKIYAAQRAPQSLIGLDDDPTTTTPLDPETPETTNDQSPTAAPTS